MYEREVEVCLLTDFCLGIWVCVQKNVRFVRCNIHRTLISLFLIFLPLLLSFRYLSISFSLSIEYPFLLFFLFVFFSHF